MEISNSRYVLSSIVSVLALIAISCGDSDSSVDGIAFDDVRHRSSTTDIERPYDSVADLTKLIAEQHEVDGDIRQVVVGTITSIDPGRSFAWPIDDEIGEAARVELPFGDSDAEIHTAHLTVAVSETVSPADHEATQTVNVGVAFDAKVHFDEVQADYRSLDEVVLFLRPSAVFDYEPGIYGIYEDGAMMGVLDPDGTVTFPLLAEPDSLDAARPIELESLRAAGVEGTG